MITKKVRVIRNGKTSYEDVKVKRQEVKDVIKKAHGWDDATYKKQYDLFKNKLRAYEAFVKENDPNGKHEQQSPIEILYKQAKAMKRAQASGEVYEPSLAMKRIQSFSALSITKGRQAVKSESYMQRYGEKYAKYTAQQFEGYLADNTSAKALYDELIAKGATPAQIERALSDHANKNYARRKANGKAEGGSVATQAGESFGSDDAVDININDYLQ